LSKPKPSDTTAAVDAFMDALEHPHKDAVAALRLLMCGADPSIAEGVKWNAPSFRTSEYFATTHLRAKSGIALILHLGAKVRETDGFQIDDPDGMLKWLAKDRAMITILTAEHIERNKDAFTSIVRQWIKFVSVK
jgi:hypothetical protein